MNIPLLSYLVHLIEEVLKEDGPVIAKAATEAAIETAEQDPKVAAVTEASSLLLASAQNLKTAISEHPDAPVVTPAPAAEGPAA